MKMISLVISIIFLVIGMPPQKGQIEIFIKDCRSDNFVYYKTVQIKLVTGKVIDKVITRKDNKIKRLEPGAYEIEFESILGRKEVEKIRIEDNEKVELIICLNKFSRDKEPIKQITIIDSIKVGEKYRIMYDSRGCFNSIQDSLEIERKSEGYFINCEKKLAKLNQNQIESIRDFELQLFNGKMLGGCTTSDTYSLKYKAENVLINIDQSCAWKGFGFIKRKLKKEICMQQSIESP